MSGRVRRITLILFVIVLANWAAGHLTGYTLIGGDLFLFFLIAFSIWLLLKKLFKKSM